MRSAAEWIFRARQEAANLRLFFLPLSSETLDHPDVALITFTGVTFVIGAVSSWQLAAVLLSIELFTNATTFTASAASSSTFVAISRKRRYSTGGRATSRP